ncbi:MAG: TIGR03545 family protein [Desulfobacterales bacterium]|nr:TIGR03545 family protein [Desulfobacterales bacterium]
MKKWIRWKGLFAFLGFVLVVSSLWFLLVDGFIEKLIEKYGTKALGAKVEVTETDLSVLPAGLEIIGLQLTNPDKPMENAVEISRVNLSLDTMNLFRRKIIIDEMAVEGIQLNTPRQISGAVVSESDVSPEVPLKSSQKMKFPEIAMPDIETIDVKEIIKNEELESIKILESIQDDIESEKKRWEKQLEALLDKEKYAEYKDRIEQIKSKKRKTFEGILTSASDVSDIKKEIQSDLDSIKQSRNEFEKMFSSFKSRINQASKAPMRDVERLKQKYSLSPKNLSNFSQLLFGKNVSKGMQKVLYWYDKLKPYLMKKTTQKENGKEVVKPIRGRGVNIRFKEYKPLPDFLIRQTKAELQLESGDIKGLINNITPDQHILAIPLTFEFSGNNMKDIQSVKINGILDHIKAAQSKDNIYSLIKGYNVDKLTLSDETKLPVKINKASADLEMMAILRNDNISANIIARLESVKFSSDYKDQTSSIANSIKSALSDVSKFSTRADINGTLDDYKINITSDLDNILKDALEKVINKEMEKLENKLRNTILAKVDDHLEQTNKSMSNLGIIKDELKNRLNLGNMLLGDFNLKL